MAGNTQRIDDLVDLPIVEAQLKTTKQLSADLTKQFIDNLNAANNLNTALSKVGNNSQFKKIVSESDAATQKVVSNQSRIAKAEAERIRLEEKRKRIVQESTKAELEAANANRQGTLSTLQNTSATAANANAATAATAANQRYGTQARVTATAVTQETGTIAANTAAIETNTAVQASAIARVGQGLTKGLGYLRTLAYILPGIGVAGIFTLAFEGISALADKLFDTGEKFDAFASKVKALNDVYSNSNREIASQTTQLKYLYASATDVNNAMGERLQSAKKLQEEYPKTFGLQSQENIINGQAVGIYKTLSEEIIKNAKAKAAASRITEEETRILDAEIQKQKIRGANQLEVAEAERKRQEVIRNTPQGGAGFRGGLATTFANEIVASNKRAQEAFAVQNQIIATAKNNVKAIENILGGATAIGNGINDTGNGDTPRKSTVYEDMLRQQKEILDSTLEYEKSSYDDRLTAIAAFEAASLFLIREGVKTKEFTEIEASTKSIDVTNTTNKERLKVESDAQKELANLFKDGLKTQKEILENSSNTFKAASAARLLQADQERQQMLDIIADQYEKGIISKAAFEQKKADIEYSYNVESVQNSIQLAQDLIRVKKEQDEDTTNDEIELAKLQIKLSEQVTNKKLADLDKQKERQKQVNAAIKDLAEASANFVIELINAGFTNRKNALRGEQDQLEEQTQKEIDAVDRSLATEQEKADRIAVIRARDQSQKDRIARQQRQIDVEKAKFDKAVAIARVIENTAIGITSALAQFPPNVPLSILIGALGAVQLGTVLAQPIPAYKSGTNSAKGGLSIVGEEGRERIDTPDGKSFLSPNTASLINLPRGSKVTPHHETMRMIGRPEKLGNYAGGEQVPWREVIAAIERNKPQKSNNKINVKVDAGFYIYRENHFR